MKKDFVNSILYWIPMPIIGIGNGAFRQMVLLKYFSETSARQLSSLSLITLLVFYVSLIFARLRVKRASKAWQIGFVWVFLTLAFEFVLGYFVMHNSMASILAEYNVGAGKLWAFIPLTILVLPLMFFKLGNFK